LAYLFWGTPRADHKVIANGKEGVRQLVVGCTATGLGVVWGDGCKLAKDFVGLHECESSALLLVTAVCLQRGEWPLICIGFGFFRLASLLSPLVSTMASTSQQSTGRDGVLPALDIVIQGLDLAKDTCGIPPAQAVFGIVSALLTMIRARFPHFAMTNF
jgi:hypothetical protein